MKTIDDILKRYKVKSFKTTINNYIAIRKKVNGRFEWWYFNWDGNNYCMSGFSNKFQKN